MKRTITGYCPKCGNQIVFDYDASLDAKIEEHLTFSCRRKRNRKVCVGGNTMREALQTKIQTLSEENTYWGPHDSLYGDVIESARFRLRRG